MRNRTGTGTRHYTVSPNRYRYLYKITEKSWTFSDLSFPYPGLLRVGILLEFHPGQDKVVGTDLQGLISSHHNSMF
jgi:hypothetical protein